MAPQSAKASNGSPASKSNRKSTPSANRSSKSTQSRKSQGSSSNRGSNKQTKTNNNKNTNKQPVKYAAPTLERGDFREQDVRWHVLCGCVHIRRVVWLYCPLLFLLAIGSIIGAAQLIKHIPKVAIPFICFQIVLVVCLGLPLVASFYPKPILVNLGAGVSGLWLCLHVFMAALLFMQVTTEDLDVTRQQWYLDPGNTDHKQVLAGQSQVTTGVWLGGFGLLLVACGLDVLVVQWAATTAVFYAAMRKHEFQCERAESGLKPYPVQPFADWSGDKRDNQSGSKGSASPNRKTTPTNSSKTKGSNSSEPEPVTPVTPPEPAQPDVLSAPAENREDQPPSQRPDFVDPQLADGPVEETQKWDFAMKQEEAPAQNGHHEPAPDMDMALPQFQG